MNCTTSVVSVRACSIREYTRLFAGEEERAGVRGEPAIAGAWTRRRARGARARALRWGGSLDERIGRVRESTPRSLPTPRPAESARTTDSELLPPPKLSEKSIEYEKSLCCAPWASGVSVDAQTVGFHSGASSNSKLRSSKQEPLPIGLVFPQF